MYKENILALWKEPENFRKLETHTHVWHGLNESCGDDIVVYLAVVAGVIRDAAFTGKGCALCMASASVATESAKGKSIDGLNEMSSEDLLKMLEIEVHPARLKCILLPLESMQKAVRENKK